MRIDVISAVPDLLHSPLQHSIMQRAQDKGILEVHIHDLRAFGHGPHRQIDDYQYGGGAGMVMMIDPILRCIEGLQAERKYDEIVYTAPDGQQWDQSMANRYSLKKNIIIICGHYKGIDDRLREHVITDEITIGEYVLSGGELPALVMIDSIGRLLPGVLNNESSALFDSHQDGMIAPPVYTRPAEYRGWKVPDILLSGHDAKITAWREEQSQIRTDEFLKRKD